MTSSGAGNSLSAPTVEFRSAEMGALEDDVLGAVAYGPGLDLADPRILNVGLAPLEGTAHVEIWRAGGPVEVRSSGRLRYAQGDGFLFGSIEIDEDEHDGLVAASEAAYREISRTLGSVEERHLLRVWNFVDSINEGAGDEERYKQFCLGRARGLDWLSEEALPAATAVGKRDGLRTLQVCWLSGRLPGQPLENPRQTCAYRYPRRYGPAPPSFSRAIVAHGRRLWISGTASITGSESRHPGDVDGQFRETLRNLERLLEAAASLDGEGGPARQVQGTVLKAYLRDRAAAHAVGARLAAALPGVRQLLLLEADICREELVIEIECVCDQPVPAGC